jgi:hypothetical protein
MPKLPEPTCHELPPITHVLLSTVSDAVELF